MKINQLVSIRYLGLLGMRVRISQLPPYLKKTPDLIKFWGFLLPKIYPYEYHSFTAKYLIDRYY